MKPKPISLRAVTAIVASLILALVSLPAKGETLTPADKAKAQERLAEIRDRIADKNSTIQKSAADIFLTASQSPDAAVALYTSSYKKVNFDMEEREEDEFEDWHDRQKDNFKDPRFLEGLQTQLRYLALSCRAAESETLDQIFPNLLSYIEGLSRLTEMPSQFLLQDISGSVFAKAYMLETLLERRDDWEGTPMNIAGIYERTVLPYLRENQPDKLMGAWEKRVSQQTLLVDFFEAMENRGNRREDRKRSENEVRQMQGGRTGGIVKAHDRDDFIRDTLPELKLGMLKDKYLFVDQAAGAVELIAFLEENINHEKAMDWLDQINLLISGGGQLEPGSETPYYTPPSGTETTTGSPPVSGSGAPAAPGKPATTGTGSPVPLGLEPVK